MNRPEAYLECVRCHKTYDLGEVRYKCDCGGTLDLRRDLAKLDGEKLKDLWEKRWGARHGLYRSGVWRYRELIFDVPDEFIPVVSQGFSAIRVSITSDCGVIG